MRWKKEDNKVEDDGAEGAVSEERGAVDDAT